MSDVLVAAEATWPIWLFIAGMALLALLLLWLSEPRKRNSEPRSRVLRAAGEGAREDARTASLTYWRDTNPELAAAAEQAWEDHPARRADIAKTRTAATHARMTREAWLNSPVTANDFDLWADEKGSAS